MSDDVLMFVVVGVFMSFLGYILGYMRGTENYSEYAYLDGIAFGEKRAYEMAKIYPIKGAFKIEMDAAYRTGFADGRKSAVGYESMENFKKLEEQFPRLKGG